MTPPAPISPSDRTSTLVVCVCGILCSPERGTCWCGRPLPQDAVAAIHEELRAAHRQADAMDAAAAKAKPVIP